MAWFSARLVMTSAQIKDYLAKIGREGGKKGGKRKGKRKVRGDSEYYRKLRAKRPAAYQAERRRAGIADRSDEIERQLTGDMPRGSVNGEPVR